MRKFTDISVTPPGGFLYVCPETKTAFRHIVFTELLKKIRLFRLANGMLLAPGWEAEAEDLMCDNCPPEIWRYEDPDPQPDGRHIQLKDVANFIAVMGGFLAAEQKFVGQEEADRRAGICAACPKNQVVEGCTPCARLLEKINRAVGNRVTKYDGQLKACAVCACSIPVSVFVPLEILHKGLPDDLSDKLPEWCWKKKEPKL